MHTDEQFEELELEERELTEETILLMIALLTNTRTELENEIRSFYQKYGKDGVVTYSEARKWVSYKDHRRRLSVLIVIIITHFTDLYDQLDSTMKKLLLDIIEKECDFFDVKTSESENEDILTRTWGSDESKWDERLFANTEKWTTKVANEVKRALITKKSVDEIIDELVEWFENIQNALYRLCMTESTAIDSITRLSIFKELGITKYRYYARADERTCEHCGSLHGLIFPISAFEVGVTASPIHPNCRCWITPVLD